MHDVVELLERTTPYDAGPVDTARLAERARRRRAVRRAAVATPVIALVAVLAAVVLPGEGPDGEVVVPAGPLEGVTGAPVGQWVDAAAPPFVARGDAFAFATDDERVVVWGGSTPGDGGREGGGTLTDGGVYDPAAGTWEAIPPAPVPNGLSFHHAQFAGNRLAVLGSDNGGDFHGAVYDVDSGEWTALPSQEGIRVVIDAMAWTGETLALVRVEPGLDETGGRLGNWRVDEPLTLRWTVGAEAWTEGAAPPLQQRFGAGAGFDGEQVALWGGTTGDVRSDGGPGEGRLLGDGAVYDVEADRWSMMADSPLSPAIHPALSWQGERVMVGGGLSTLTDATGFLPGLAAYSPSDDTWTSLPDAPAGGPAEERPSTRLYSADDDPVVTAELLGQPGGVQPGWYFDGETWHETPFQDLHRSGATVVATTAGADTEAGDPFSVAVSSSGRAWQPAPDAPFTNRAGPALVLLDDQLVIVGGFERTTRQPVSDTWVLDLTG